MKFDDNPYRTPDSAFNETIDQPVSEGRKPGELASRGDRFWAAMLDGLFITLLTAPPLLAVGFYDSVMEGAQQPIQYQIGAAVLGFVAWLALNFYFLRKNGQTLGKKILGIKIVKQDGASAEMSRLIGLRYAIGSVIVQIPIIGYVYSLADVLFIFREDRSCIHDLIAGTKVIKA